MTQWLTPEEVEDVTGRKRPSLQREWLDRNGLPYFTSASGRPKVLRSTLERRHGPQTHEGLGPSPEALPPRLALLLRERGRQMAQPGARQGAGAPVVGRIGMRAAGDKRS